MQNPEVVVVGLGAMGALTLWRLAARGVAALGVDRFAPPHDRGSSHGGSRIIRTAYSEGAFYVPLLQEAWTLWDELERASGTRLIHPSGALMIGGPDSDVVRGALESARSHGLAHELFEAGAARARWPQHVLGGNEVALFEPRAGALLPEAAVGAALDAARARGAGVLTGRRVAGIECGDREVMVGLDGGDTLTCRHCVVAAGPWTGALLPELSASLEVERQVVAWLPVDDPAMFGPERFPVFLRQLPDGRYRYGIPSLDGATIKVAVHHEGARTAPDALLREAGPSDLGPVVEFARTALRGVRPEIARSSVCMYTNTPDERFMLGALPGRPGLTVVGGCSGHSFKFSAILGDVAADLAVDGSTRRDVAAFDPARLVGVPR
ncbi:MAG: N-methyl-L-tryptophan oxidase [Candidatus Dormibacteraeota bacterium]|nr:N-methyl-L-tryptophan oxidase [Candidatus Dormibacteraeota bacterium]MBV9526731.1 N-methyl-L-tryptophan oxidase [Candidatus Dormibacteraeota bacterium]